MSRTKSQPSPGDQIKKACEDSRTKTPSMKIELVPQPDIEWCLGIYPSDKNSSKLFEMGESGF